MTRIFPGMIKVNDYVFINPGMQSASGTNYAEKVSTEKKEIKTKKEERKVEETDSEMRIRK